MPFYEPVYVMKFCFFLPSLNPLSLMNPSRLFQNFVFLFSLVGMGSLVCGERYETAFIYTEDTVKMNNSDGRAYLQSSACISTQSITIPEGEVAYVFSSGASAKPSGTSAISNPGREAFVYGIQIDITGLDANITKKNWNMTWSDNDSIGNYSTNDPIVGPATVRILIKPWSARLGSEGAYPASKWSGYDTYQGRLTDWAFKASEGFVTFRIVGSEQAPSKKFATVIPENASTNIRVVLEQSTDLINWTTAAPGVFPPSTAKRFFRVRSEEE